MKIRLLLTLGLFAAAGVYPPAVGAQIVTGVVLDVTTSAPLPGVLVSLLDTDDERVKAALSNDAGRFHFDTGRFGRYRIRAERIGLEPAVTAVFDLFSTNPRFERVVMSERAIAIAGLVVDSRVRQCRTDREEAVQIQRWWQEVRTALDVSSVLQGQGLAQFQVERFEREWGPQLERVVSDDRRREMSLSNKPFVSAEASFLADGGFVQGSLGGQREYYAPDADVLLSSIFLSQHCFSVTDSDDEKLLGLTFEPLGGRTLPEIRGTLWVDTTTAELQSLDFRYTNLNDIPENESGGFVSFEYMPSGAWIVRDWYIRMPKLGLQRVRRRDQLVLLGYVDVGGRVTLLDSSFGAPSANSVVGDRSGFVGNIEGVVYDSIRGRGLAGATVSVLGTGFQTTTNLSGTFVITDLPVGTYGVTFFHDDPSAWGLGSPLIQVDVEGGETSRVRLALPSFRDAARIVCMGTGNQAETVLLGRLVEANGEELGNVVMELTWIREDASRRPLEFTQEIRTGSDGRFMACTIPGESVVHVRAQVDGRWIDGFEVGLPMRDIVFRRMTVPVR